MKPKSALTTGVLLLAWGVAVFLTVRLAEEAVQFCRDRQERLSMEREKLRRFRGWLKSEEKVSARHQEVLGVFAQAEGKEWGWLGLQGFQEAAQKLNLTVTELRPSQIQGKRGQPVRFRLDSKVEGRVDQIGLLIPELGQRLPGVRLQQLQVAPLQKGQVQGLFRLEWGGDG